MRTRPEIISLLTNPGVVAIVRAKSSEQFIPLSEALLEGGLRAVELTMTTPNALEAVRRARQHFGERILLGVGTVLDAAACRKAIEAGAEFIISPITKPEIVSAAREHDRPVMLGAYTATEAQLAWESGADYIKLFPADSLGPAYVKALLAPLPHLRIVPTGGVDLSNVADFLRAGCPAVGVGGSLVSRQILDRADWPGLTRLAREFASRAIQAKSK